MFTRLKIIVSNSKSVILTIRKPRKYKPIEFSLDKAFEKDWVIDAEIRDFRRHSMKKKIQRVINKAVKISDFDCPNMKCSTELRASSIITQKKSKMVNTR